MHLATPASHQWKVQPTMWLIKTLWCTYMSRLSALSGLVGGYKHWQPHRGTVTAQDVHLNSLTSGVNPVHASWWARGRLRQSLSHQPAWTLHAFQGRSFAHARYRYTSHLCGNCKKLWNPCSHICVACRRVCDWDHNRIKRSTFLFQGIETNSERLISTDQHTFLDTTEAWLRFVLWTPIKSGDQKPRNRVIKRSRMIFTDQDSWSRSQMLLQVTHMWLPLG